MILQLLSFTHDLSLSISDLFSFVKLQKCMLRVIYIIWCLCPYVYSFLQCPVIARQDFVWPYLPWGGKDLLDALFHHWEMLWCMMTSSNENICRVTGPLQGDSTDHQWISLKKFCDAKLWYFLRRAPEQTVEQTIKTPVSWKAMAFIVTSL